MKCGDTLDGPLILNFFLKNFWTFFDEFQANDVEPKVLESLNFSRFLAFVIAMGNVTHTRTGLRVVKNGRPRALAPLQSRKKCNQVGVSHVSIIHFLPWRNVCSFISLLRPLNCAAGSVFLFARAPSTGARASNFKLPAADNFPRKKNFFERKKFPRKFIFVSFRSIIKLRDEQKP